jgi:hypothetical protein
LESDKFTVFYINFDGAKYKKEVLPKGQFSEKLRKKARKKET